jgi:hypothetical protein
MSIRIRWATLSIFPWAISVIALNFTRAVINIAVCNFILREKPVILEIRSREGWNR